MPRVLTRTKSDAFLLSNTLVSSFLTIFCLVPEMLTFIGDKRAEVAQSEMPAEAASAGG